MRKLLFLVFVLSMTGCMTFDSQLRSCLDNSGDRQYCYAVYNANMARQAASFQAMSNIQPVQQTYRPRRVTCYNSAPGIVQCW